MKQPRLFFAFAFYVGSAAFAVVFSASMVAGTGADMAVLRGVQAFLAFLLVGWIAETIVQNAPAPRQAAAPPQEVRQEQPIPLRAHARTAYAEAEPAVPAAAELEAALRDDAAPLNLPTREDLMASSPLHVLGGDGANAGGMDVDGADAGEADRAA